MKVSFEIKELFKNIFFIKFLKNLLKPNKN